MRDVSLSLGCSASFVDFDLRLVRDSIPPGVCRPNPGIMTEFLDEGCACHVDKI
jgi:hypothetical protein